MSEIKMNIYEKLNEVRIRLNDLNLKKTGKNNNSNFSYFELKDFLPHTLLLFKEFGLYSKFDIINEVANDNGVYEEMAVLKIVNVDDPDEVEIYKSPTAEVKIGVRKDGTGGAQPIQNLGGKHTYCKRYLYQNALELSVNDIVDESLKEEQYEIWQDVTLPMSQSIKVVKATIKELIQKLGSRITDLYAVWDKQSMGGKLEDCSLKQLFQIEKELSKANFDSHKWYGLLYGKNQRVKSYVEVNTKIDYKRSKETFGEYAISVSNQEVQLDIVNYWLDMSIDLTDYRENLLKDKE
jgi:hypothetical protein